MKTIKLNNNEYCLLTEEEDSNVETASHFVSYLIADYKVIKEIVGDETYPKGDEYKVDAEWRLLDKDNNLITIYNYKDGHNYCGREGLSRGFITDWHVGGNNGIASQQFIHDFVAEVSKDGFIGKEEKVGSVVVNQLN